MVGKPGISPKRKGLIRLVLGLGLALWGLQAARPAFKAAKTFLASRHGKAEPRAESLPAAEKQMALAPAPSPTPHGTPVARLKGRAAALVYSGGRWYECDAGGRLQPSGGPEEKGHLGLPVLEGAGMAPAAEGSEWVWKLQADAADLDGLLPLNPQVAQEVDKVLLSEAGDPRLVTHDGTVASLGRGGLQDKEARLAAVLADLAPKKVKAWQIDMRYENSAVVRMASK
jgi:hypothetical protein